MGNSTKAIQAISVAFDAAIGVSEAAEALKAQKADVGNAVLEALQQMEAVNRATLSEDVAKVKVAYYSAKGWKGSAKWYEGAALHTVKIEGNDKPANTVSGYFSRINKALELGLVFADYDKWSDLVDATKPEADPLDEVLSELFKAAKKLDKAAKESIITAMKEYTA